MTFHCECKGIRACALCDHSRTPSHRLRVSRIGRTFLFCPKCSVCFEVDKNTGQVRDGLLKLPGLHLALEAISPENEKLLQHQIEIYPWTESQSGRRKQDFGPKVNFKKQKVKTDSFIGFPSYMDIVTQSFGNLSSVNMADFEPVELCNLKYSPDRGSCIDPHFDDSWLWGERLVTLNLCGATVLSFSRAEDLINLTQTSDSDDQEIYALSTEKMQKLSENHICQTADNCSNEQSELVSLPGDVIHVVLPRRSVVLVKDEARFKWHHSVLREHVQETRLAMTCRELSENFRNPEKVEEFAKGRELLKKARINSEIQTEQKELHTN